MVFVKNEGFEGFLRSGSGSLILDLGFILWGSCGYILGFALFGRGALFEIEIGEVFWVFKNWCFLRSRSKQTLFKI